MEATMRPTTAYDNVLDFNALYLRQKSFEHPRDVVTDTFLSIVEKRHAGVLGFRCMGSHIFSRIAMASSSEGPGQDRRDPRGIARAGLLPSQPAGGKPFRLRSAERAIAA
jgi:hypothetical protein